MRWQTIFEARWIIAVLAVAAAITTPFLPWLGLLWLLLFLYVLWFFRDPDRLAPADARAIVSGADGVIAAIEEMEETEVTQQPMRRVAIFLSVFNVHTNRAPIAGEITYRKHFPGTYLDARNPECSVKNEAQTWAFKGECGTLVLRQITGAIARRIVAWSKVGETVAKGERFGMIRFGSRTEIYLPLDCEIVVKIGDKVEGGRTVIANFPR